jgi:hypothetical protein
MTLEATSIIDAAIPRCSLQDVSHDEISREGHPMRNEAQAG